MSCRECLDCARRFGTGVNEPKCIFCQGILEYTAGKNPTVTAEEYQDQLYVIGKKVPASLNEEELTLLEREWEAISVEVGRRGSQFWSEADLIAEGFRPI